MKKKKKSKKVIQFTVCLLVPLAVGGVAAFLIRNSMKMYENLRKPIGAPPSMLFPIAWTVLYILMGISLYLVYRSDSPFKKRCIILFALQLAINFVWPLLFFRGAMYFVSFIWLLLLWGVLLAMILAFNKVRPVAAWLQLPYLLWITFAGYLNLGIALMN